MPCRYFVIVSCVRKICVYLVRSPICYTILCFVLNFVKIFLILFGLQKESVLPYLDFYLLVSFNPLSVYAPLICCVSSFLDPVLLQFFFQFFYFKQLLPLCRMFCNSFYFTEFICQNEIWGFQNFLLFDSSFSRLSFFLFIVLSLVTFSLISCCFC